MLKPAFLSLIALVTPLLLASCGGGLGTDDDEPLTDSELRALVKASNIEHYRIPVGTGSPAVHGTSRWVGSNAAAAPQIAVFVPSPVGSTESDLATRVRQAIATLNQKLAGRLRLTEVTTLPTNTGFLRVSYLTGYVPAGSTNYQAYCANVATGPSLPDPVVPETSSGRFDARVAWINLGNGRCNVTQDIVIHELGHALGLGGHFEGFGNGTAISDSFWDALATLYANPVKTTAAQLAVARAAN